MIFLAVIILLYIAYFYIENFYNPKPVKNKQTYKYTEKKFITKQERYFFNIFKELEKELNIIVHPQLNLASIINKCGGKYRNELFRNIDFAFFSKDYEKLLFLVEVNDKTHLKYKRRKRDNRVKEICSDANIKLIIFDTRYDNTKEYIINRIKKAYNEMCSTEEIKN